MKSMKPKPGLKKGTDPEVTLERQKEHSANRRTQAREDQHACKRRLRVDETEAAAVGNTPIAPRAPHVQRSANDEVTRKLVNRGEDLVERIRAATENTSATADAQRAAPTPAPQAVQPWIQDEQASTAWTAAEPAAKAVAAAKASEPASEPAPAPVTDVFEQQVQEYDRLLATLGPLHLHADFIPLYADVSKGMKVVKLQLYKHSGRNIDLLFPPAIYADWCGSRNLQVSQVHQSNAQLNAQPSVVQRVRAWATPRVHSLSNSGQWPKLLVAVLVIVMAVLIASLLTRSAGTEKPKRCHADANVGSNSICWVADRGVAIGTTLVCPRSVPNKEIVWGVGLPKESKTNYMQVVEERFSDYVAHLSFLNSTCPSLRRVSSMPKIGPVALPMGDIIDFNTHKNERPNVWVRGSPLKTCEDAAVEKLEAFYGTLVYVFMETWDKFLEDHGCATSKCDDELKAYTQEMSGVAAILPTAKYYNMYGNESPQLIHGTDIPFPLHSLIVRQGYQWVFGNQIQGIMDQHSLGEFTEQVKTTGSKLSGGQVKEAAMTAVQGNRKQHNSEHQQEWRCVDAQKGGKFISVEAKKQSSYNIRILNMES